MHGTVRLYVDADLTGDGSFALSPEQSHYVVTVMRRRAGDEVLLFNGRDGEWRAVVAVAGKRSCRLDVREQARSQEPDGDIWLLFAPLKRQRLDWLIEKATELGVGRLCPVRTRHTVATRLNTDRLLAHAIEAAEQSRRLSVPDIAEPQELAHLLAGWPRDRRLLFCDLGGAPPIAEVLCRETAGAWGLFTGPEGGLSADERAALLACDFVVPASLGRRVLRAETAAVAALSIWQALVPGTPGP